MRLFERSFHEVLDRSSFGTLPSARNFGEINYVSYERAGAPQPPIYLRGDRAMSKVGHLRNKIAKLEVQFFW
jgi:hypothetical protein